MKRCSTGPNVIDLSSPNKRLCENLSRPQPWLHVSNINLSLVDKNILSSGDLMNDKHINAAQILLKNQFPEACGLMDTLIVSNQLSGEGLPNINSSMTNIIQLHNLPGHWLVSQSNGQSVIVYDSLYPGMTHPLTMQLVYLYKSIAKGGLLLVKLRCCQKQAGFVDCGLFAIANAVSLANGIYPGAVIFQQSQMRQHLKQCLERKQLTMFPHEVNKEPCHILERSTMIKC